MTNTIYSSRRRGDKLNDSISEKTLMQDLADFLVIAGRFPRTEELYKNILPYGLTEYASIGNGDYEKACQLVYDMVSTKEIIPDKNRFSERVIDKYGNVLFLADSKK